MAQSKNSAQDFADSLYGCGRDARRGGERHARRAGDPGIGARS
jgi:hypothetical protein